MKRRTQIFLLGLVILAVPLTLLSGLLINAVELPPVLKPFDWLLLSLDMLALIFIGVGQFILQRDTEHPPLAPQNQNRRRMLERVHAIWIKGLLEQSLYEATLIVLGLHEQAEMVSKPWRLAVQELSRPARPLSHNTRITQVYDDAGGRLLILGEPGAGKTTLLLELARDLLDRARDDDTHPIPVVFNLSSWAAKEQHLAGWLVEELKAKYQVPRKCAQSWIESDQVLPLLDGLDEVSSVSREKCVQAINAYQREHMTPLVVCCRSQDYRALPTRVTLQQAISIQPLTDEQIEHYMQSTKGQLEGLRHALHTDRELHELARQPLMLNILSLTYQGADPKEFLTEGTREAQQLQVFTAYVERMLSRRRAFTHISRERMLRWLAIVAVQMLLHNQTVLYLEGLQPDLLIDPRKHTLYWLSVRLVFGLLSGLLTGLVFGLVFGLGFALVFGLVFGLLVGVCPQLEQKVGIAKQPKRTMLFPATC